MTDGLINLYKPGGITSAKAVYRVRRITRVRKSGHAGTLDPAAEGVLLICQGQATRLVEQLMNLPKVYRAQARLDVTSASLDSDSPLQPVEIPEIPTQAALETALVAFRGPIQQVPPAISAVKVGGIPAYKLARQNESPYLAARTVVVYWLRLRAYAWPHVDVEMACGRGTYVRALIRDLGIRLGVGGCLTGLRREAVGPFRATQAWTFERMETGPPGEYILPLAAARALLAQPDVCNPPSADETSV